MQNSAEAQRILSNVADLPVGGTITLPDIANDGWGGMVVKRHSAKTLVFQREFMKGRSRWADGLAQALEDIEVYVATGKLHEPDRVVGW